MTILVGWYCDDVVKTDLFELQQLRKTGAPVWNKVNALLTTMQISDLQEVYASMTNSKGGFQHESTGMT